MSSTDRDHLAQLQARLDRFEALHRVGRVIHSTLELRESLQLILGEAMRLMRANSGSVCLLNPTTGRLEIEAAHGLPADAMQVRLRLGEGITGIVAKTGRPVRIGDVTKDPRYVAVRPEVRAELAVPLRVGDEVRGVINVDGDRPDAFTDDDLVLLEELAALAAPAIQNTWLYEQARQKARLFESLVRVGQTINSTLNLDDALHAITREACSLINARMGSLMMLDASGEWLDLRASHGAGATYVSKPRLSVGDSLLGIVVRRRKPTQVENVQTSARYQNVDVARREGLVSLLSVPLLFSGRVLGTLNVYTAESHVFSDEEVRILSAYAELSALALEKARLYDRLVVMEEEMRQNERLSALGLLAAEIAHEIRNPLTVMKMLHHSLDLQFAEGDPRRTDVRIMGEKMDHLNRIVDRVLDLARRPEPRLEQVHLNQLLGDLTVLTRHKLKQQQVELISQLDPDVPTFVGDPTQLEQAFLNLTLNAVEAMPEGGRLTIRSRAVRARLDPLAFSHVLVSFGDTGVGMAQEQRERAFSSLLSSTKLKGTGLGLAIVARVVEAHHGRIRIRSRPQKGTAITIALPLTGEARP